MARAMAGAKKAGAGDEALKSIHDARRVVEEQPQFAVAARTAQDEVVLARHMHGMGMPHNDIQELLTEWRRPSGAILLPEVLDLMRSFFDIKPLAELTIPLAIRVFELTGKQLKPLKPQAIELIGIISEKDYIATSEEHQRNADTITLLGFSFGLSAAELAEAMSPSRGGQRPAGTPNRASDVAGQLRDRSPTPG